jgi:hypothetical protein
MVLVLVIFNRISIKPFPITVSIIPGTVRATVRAMAGLREITKTVQ